MNLLMNLANIINVLSASNGANTNGMVFIGIGLACIGMGCSGIGEGYIGGKTIEGMSRNPEMYSKLRTGMIVACALAETTAIYALLAIILMLFVV